MKQAKDVAARLLAGERPKPTKPAPGSSPSPEELRIRALFMVDVWEKLGDCFGMTWENSFGNADGEAIRTWAAGLAHFSETSIRAALDLMKGWEKPFPPSLGEFAAICRQYRPAVDPNKQLTHHTRAPQEVGERELRKMKAITRGEYPETTEEALRSLGRK